MLFMGFARQECWRSFPIPSPMDHILSELSTMTCQSWVAQHMAHSFTELDKAVIHVITWLVLVSFLWLWFLFHLPSDGYEACASFLMGGTGCGENWVLLCWAGPGSVHLQLIFLLMGGAVLPPVSCLAWGNPVLRSTGSLLLFSH